MRYLLFVAFILGVHSQAFAQTNKDAIGFSESNFSANSIYVGKITKNYVHCTAEYEKVPRSTISPEVLKDLKAMEELKRKEAVKLYSCSEASIDRYRYSEIKLNQNWRFVASLNKQGYLVTQLISYDQVAFSTQKTAIPEGAKGYSIFISIQGFSITCTVSTFACNNSRKLCV